MLPVGRTAPDFDMVTTKNLDTGRSIEETLRLLQALQAGGLCAANWKPGQKTL